MAKMSMKTAVFYLGEKSVIAREISVDDYLNGLFADKGYHLMNARTLPQKMLAVCSGLGKYGKLGIYPWTLKDIPAKLEHMFAHIS